MHAFALLIDHEGVLAKVRAQNGRQPPPARLVAILGEWQRFLRRAAAAPSGAEWRFGSTNDAAVRRYSADVDEHEATAVDESHPAAAAAAVRRQAKRKRAAGV